MVQRNIKLIILLTIIASFPLIGIYIVTVRVSINHVPVFEIMYPNATTALTLDQTVTCSVQASDPDFGDDLTFQWSARDALNNPVAGLGSPNSTSGNPATSQISFTPLATGTSTVSVIASDGHGGSATHDFAVMVSANHVPIFEIVYPNATTALTLGQTIICSVQASDPDLGNSLTFQWSARDALNNPVAGLGSPNSTGGNPATSQISFTPLATGTYTVSVTASDGHGGSAIHDFAVMVSANHVPIFEIVYPNATTALTLGQNVTCSVQASDPDLGNSLTFQWSARDAINNPVAGLGSPNSTGGNPATSQISFTPLATGTYTVSVTASDGHGGSAIHDFAVMVS
jgi:hypothetical protein